MRYGKIITKAKKNPMGEIPMAGIFVNPSKKKRKKNAKKATSRGKAKKMLAKLFGKKVSNVSKKAKRRKRNPSISEIAGRSVTYANIAKTTAGATVGWIIPGLLSYILSKTGFSTTLQNTFKSYSNVVIDLASLLFIQLLSKKVSSIKQYAVPMMIGSGLKAVKDLLEVSISDANTRAILGLGAAQNVLTTGTTTGSPITGTTTGSQEEQNIDSSSEYGKGASSGLELGLETGENAVGGVPYPTGMRGMVYPSNRYGMGSVYVDRQLGQGQQVTSHGYQGLGTAYVSRNLVYKQPGQRFAAKVGF